MVENCNVYSAVQIIQWVCVGYGLAQSLVCECSTPDQVVIGLSALASFTLYESNSYSETARLARYLPITAYIPFVRCPFGSRPFMGLDAIGSNLH